MKTNFSNHFLLSALYAGALICALQSASASGADARAAQSPAPVSSAKSPAQPAASAFPELEELLPGLLQKSAQPSTPGAAELFVRHDIKSGDSVERIIKKYWADLPFKDAHLRHIIFILNPKAMRAENAKSFVGGTTVLIPSASYLRSSLLTSKQNPTAIPASDPAANEVGGDIDQTKDWVRFP